MRAKLAFCRRHMCRLSVLPLVFALCVFAGTSALAGDAVNFKIHYSISPSYAFLFVAKGKGFFANANLDVKFTSGTGSLTALTELAEGKWDFSTGDIGDVIRLVSKGAGIKAVFFTYQRPPVGYAVWKSSRIFSPKDFAGKRYGAPKYSLASRELPVLCKKYNIDCKSIKFVNVNYRVEVLSFMHGDFDILGAYRTSDEMTLEALAKKNGKEIRWIDGDNEIYQEVIATTGKLLRTRPDFVKWFVRACAEGMKYTVAHPQEAADIFLKDNPALSGPGARQLVTDQVKAWSSFVQSPDTSRHGYGYGSQDRVKATLKFYNLMGITGVSPHDVYAPP